MGRPRLFFSDHYCFCFHICLSDYFCFAPIFAFLTTFASLHSSAGTSILQDFYIRFPAIFAFHQSSFYTNLRLRIFHTLVPHNLLYPELFFVPMSISTIVQIPVQSTIPQLVTHIIRQTERCSSPCFFYGSEHHWTLTLTHITTYDSIGYKHFCTFGDMLTGSVFVFCRDAYELSRLQLLATLTLRRTDKT